MIEEVLRPAGLERIIRRQLEYHMSVTKTHLTPVYPKINPEMEINPNHPNLTIWHNRIDVGLFVGVHCHQANLTLKIVRGGTPCYTMALCAQASHEDAMLSFRDITAHTIYRLAETVRSLHQAEVAETGGAVG